MIIILQLSHVIAYAKHADQANNNVSTCYTNVTLSNFNYNKSI